MKKIFSKWFWKIPLPLKLKVAVRNMFPQIKENGTFVDVSDISPCSNEVLESYCKTVLDIPSRRREEYMEYREYPKNAPRRALLCAYYLTQYHPTEKNNLWWGKGTTEWTNVSKAVPQYPSHYQPRLPGELGFYDLRLKDNMRRQIELAKNYGIDAFSFYYYWFNGERALELPLNNFLNDDSLDIKFCLCWCNEDWTRRYSGTSSEVLLSVGKSEDSYIRFIQDVIPTFKDRRYMEIDGRYVLIIYRPSEMPSPENTIKKWRNEVKIQTGKDLYLIASQERSINENWTKKGFDAVSQFQPASCIEGTKEITSQYQCIRSDFNGHLYDYEDAHRQAMEGLKKHKKIYPAVMPMWDNTSRRNNCPNVFENSTPYSYYRWLKDAIDYVSMNDELEEKMVFINAWNEWGEGAYIEPDREYGYAYLEESYNANCC